MNLVLELKNSEGALSKRVVHYCVAGLAILGALGVLGGLF